MLESNVEDALRNGIEAKGGECVKFVSPGRKGAPDRIVLLPPHGTIYVETKAPDGVLKSWQKRYHKMLQRAGNRVLVIWNLKQVERFLESL
jgi:hypothetical protein